MIGSYGDIIGDNTWFDPVWTDWQLQKALKVGETGCEGRCAFTVRAPAFALDHCVSRLEHREFLKPLNKTEAKLVENGCQEGLTTLLDREVFVTSFLMVGFTRHRSSA